MDWWFGQRYVKFILFVCMANLTSFRVTSPESSHKTLSPKFLMLRPTGVVSLLMVRLDTDYLLLILMCDLQTSST